MQGVKRVPVQLGEGRCFPPGTQCTVFSEIWGGQSVPHCLGYMIQTFFKEFIYFERQKKREREACKQGEEQRRRERKGERISSRLYDLSQNQESDA